MFEDDTPQTALSNVDRLLAALFQARDQHDEVEELTQLSLLMLQLESRNYVHAFCIKGWESGASIFRREYESGQPNYSDFGQISQANLASLVQIYSDLLQKQPKATSDGLLFAETQLRKSNDPYGDAWAMWLYSALSHLLGRDVRQMLSQYLERPPKADGPWLGYGDETIDELQISEEQATLTPRSIYEVYLFQGSPFIPALNQNVWNDIIDNARFMPIRVAIVLGLKPLADTHLMYLQSHPELLVRFRTAPFDLILYRMGYLAPLEIFTLAFYKLMNMTEQIYVLLESREKADGQKFASFLMSKIDQCVNLFQQDDLEEKVFNLAYGYDRSDYYRVGITVAEMTYRGYNSAIMKILDKKTKKENR